MGSLRKVGCLLQRGSLYTLLVMLPFSKAVIELSFPFLLIGWVLEHGVNGGASSMWRHRSLRPILLMLLLYLGVCALSILTSSHPDLSARGFIRKTLEYALFFVLIADVVRAPEVARRSITALLIGASLVCLDVFVQAFLSSDQVLRDRLHAVGLAAVSRGETGFNLVFRHLMPVVQYGRITGPYENPTDLATYLIVVIPVALSNILPAKPRNKWALGLLTLLLLSCLVNAGSQGAWIGFVGGLVLLVWAMQEHKRILALGCAGLIALGLMIQWTGIFGRAPIDHAMVGLRDRLYMWQAAWRMIQEQPILGLGLNTFMANYLTYWVGGEQQPRYAHNCFLQVAAETGLLGLITFSWLMGILMRFWWRVVKAHAVGQERAVLLGLMAGLGAFLVQSVFDTNFYALRQAVLFWALAGVATGLAVNTLRQAGDAHRPA